MKTIGCTNPSINIPISKKYKWLGNPKRDEGPIKMNPIAEKKKQITNYSFLGVFLNQ